MEDNLSVNSKLVSFDGVIGRRDYFLNLIIISSIAIFYTLPYSMWVMTKITQFTDIFSLNTLFFNAPIFIKVWYILGVAGVSYLLVSNIVRRLNDISGRNNLPLNIIFSLIFVINAFGAMFPTKFIYLIGFIAFILGLFLIFKKGKITSQLPYDYTKEFNWGAFFGTWIWGLFNKSYIPLFHLLLFFTPWNIYFQLYCGLKGNEWAYKNKKWEDVSKFNKSQEKQTIFWSIYTCVIVPILYFVLIFAIAFLMIAFIGKDSNGKPNMAKLEKFVETMTSIYYESYEIEPNENKFYVLSSDWNTYSFSDKKQLLDMAANISANERYKANPKVHTNKMAELPRTKIYSANNLQLLAEFKMDETIAQKDNAGFMEYVKAGISAYKFYNAEE